MGEADLTRLRTTHLPGFEQINGLPQDLSKITSIDLVDDEKIRSVTGVGGCLQEPTWLGAESQPCVRWVGR